MKIKIKAKTAFAMAGALVDAMSDEERLSFAEQLLVRLRQKDLARLERLIPAWKTSPEILAVLKERALAAAAEIAGWGSGNGRPVTAGMSQQSSPQPASASTASSGSGNATEASSPPHRSEETGAPENGALR